MTPQDLRTAAKALYNDAHGWQLALSNDLAVNDRTLRRWLAGQLNIPEGVEGELTVIMKARAAELLAAAEVLGEVGV